MLFDSGKVIKLIREYKHSNVFYLGAKPQTTLKGKSVDHSEIAQSTQMQSDNGETLSKQALSSIVAESDREELVVFGSQNVRFFKLYFYTVKINYSRKTFVDHFLLERDELSADFLDLYLKDLLTTQLSAHFVTRNEVESKLTRNQAVDLRAVFRAIRLERRIRKVLLSKVYQTAPSVHDESEGQIL